MKVCVSYVYSCVAIMLMESLSSGIIGKHTRGISTAARHGGVTDLQKLPPFHFLAFKADRLGSYSGELSSFLLMKHRWHCHLGIPGLPHETIIFLFQAPTEGACAQSPRCTIMKLTCYVEVLLCKTSPLHHCVCVLKLFMQKIVALFRYDSLMGCRSPICLLHLPSLHIK